MVRWASPSLSQCLKKPVANSLISSALDSTGGAEGIWHSHWHVPSSICIHCENVGGSHCGAGIVAGGACWQYYGAPVAGVVDCMFMLILMVLIPVHPAASD